MNTIEESKKIPLKLMTMEDAKRIQRAECLENNGQVEKGGFAARAMRAAMKNESQTINQNLKK